MGERQSTWRLRSGALIVGAVVVVAACLALYLASRQRAGDDGSLSAGVEVLLAPKPETPRPPPPRVAPTPGAVPFLAPRPSADPILSQMLTCFGVRRREHPTECPNPPRPQEFDPFARLPAGRDFARPEPVDRNAIYSPGELMTLAPAIPCMTDIGPAQVCTHVTPDPPPPSRTPEQICDAGGVGPCRTPPFVPPTRAAHTD